MTILEEYLSKGWTHVQLEEELNRLINEYSKVSYNYDFQSFTGRRHRTPRNRSAGSGTGEDDEPHRHGCCRRMAHDSAFHPFHHRHLHLRQQMVDDPQGGKDRQELHERYPRHDPRRKDQVGHRPLPEI